MFKYLIYASTFSISFFVYSASIDFLIEDFKSFCDIRSKPALESPNGLGNNEYLLEEHFPEAKNLYHKLNDPSFWRDKQSKINIGAYGWQCARETMGEECHNIANRLSCLLVPVEDFYEFLETLFKVYVEKYFKYRWQSYWLKGEIFQAIERRDIKAVEGLFSSSDLDLDAIKNGKHLWQYALDTMDEGLYYFVLNNIELFSLYSIDDVDEYLNRIDPIYCDCNPLMLLMTQPTSSITDRRSYLFLGSGNMSYELAFAKKHPKLAEKMVVTILKKHIDSKMGQEKAAQLRNLGVLVLCGIDATKLESYPGILAMRPQHIFFSHPHTGNLFRGYKTKKLVHDTLESCSKIQPYGGMFHLIRVRGGDYEKRKGLRYCENKLRRNSYYKGMYGLYKYEGPYQLIRKHRFSTDRYEGYQHEKTKSLGSASIVQGNNSLEYLFEKRRDCSPYKEFSEEISSDDGSLEDD